MTEQRKLLGRRHYDEELSRRIDQIEGHYKDGHWEDRLRSLENSRAMVRAAVGLIWMLLGSLIVLATQWLLKR